MYVLDHLIREGWEGGGNKASEEYLKAFKSVFGDMEPTIQRQRKFAKMASDTPVYGTEQCVLCIPD